jgi:23S rRNA-/tRNA-specific pseudouridylate synthase
VLARTGGRALVAARPTTGRTHQLRVQLAAAGHPVVGDDHYGPPFAPGAPSAAGRVQLHAARLVLPALRDSPPRAFEAPPPPDFAAQG